MNLRHTNWYHDWQFNYSAVQIEFATVQRFSYSISLSSWKRARKTVSSTNMTSMPREQHSRQHHSKYKNRESEYKKGGARDWTLPGNRANRPSAGTNKCVPGTVELCPSYKCTESLLQQRSEEKESRFLVIFTVCKSISRSWCRNLCGDKESSRM